MPEAETRAHGSSKTRIIICQRRSLTTQRKGGGNDGVDTYVTRREYLYRDLGVGLDDEGIGDDDAGVEEQLVGSSRLGIELDSDVAGSHHTRETAGGQ
jgi:hypothetical protein